MDWHDGTERRRFEREQAELRKQYLAAGMTDAQIQALYAFDCEWYKNRRREAVHTQRLDIQTSEDEDINKDNPLYKKFFEKLAKEDNHADNSRYGWIEEVENKQLYLAIRKLTEKDKEIVAMMVEGFNQNEIAAHFGVKKAAISRKIWRIKNFLRNFLSAVNF